MTGPMSVVSSSPSPRRTACTRLTTRSANSLAIFRATKTRAAPRQRWPAMAKPPQTVPSTAISRSASSRTRIASCSPNSRDTCFCSAAQVMATSRPTSGDPTKDTSATSGCRISGAPASSPCPCTKPMTPGANPASRKISTRRAAISGASSAGLNTTVLPAASAAASFHTDAATGNAQCVTSATTPAGSRIVTPSGPDCPSAATPSSA